jgi:hypothetical protein
MQRGRKTKKLLSIVIPVTVVLVTALFVWRPWYTPRPDAALDPWVHVTYSDAELQARQKLADSGSHSDLLDPQKTLTSFLAADNSGDGPVDLRPQFDSLNIRQVQSIEDEGEDPTNGDRLFLVTFLQQKDVVIFRLRPFSGTGQTRMWYVVGYLITSSSTPRASYSTTWQELDGSGQ